MPSTLWTPVVDMTKSWRGPQTDPNVTDGYAKGRTQLYYAKIPGTANSWTTVLDMSKHWQPESRTKDPNILDGFAKGKTQIYYERIPGTTNSWKMILDSSKISHPLYPPNTDPNIIDEYKKGQTQIYYEPGVNLQSRAKNPIQSYIASRSGQPSLTPKDQFISAKAAPNWKAKYGLLSANV